MNLTEILPWLSLLNVLLVPLFGITFRAAARLQRIESRAEAHDREDALQFAGVRRDLERVEGTANAAHRRLDSMRAPAAPLGPPL